jgi:hypothetical protein
VVLTACLLTGVAAPLPARASCAGPTLSVGPPGSTPAASSYDDGAAPPISVRPGQQLAVGGQFYLAECNDTYSCAGGCAGCSGGELSPPMRSVSLVLVTGTTETELGQQDASEIVGAVRWDVTVPTGLPPGPARLETRWDTGTLVGVPLVVQR